jgi:HK97 family phage prohead protease
VATYRGVEIDLAPTKGMKDDAQRGLDWREEYGRGGTEVGVGTARAILTDDELSPAKVTQMYAYFARHEVDKQGEGFTPGEDGYPSAGRIAWALWGGDAGQAWSTRKREELMRIDEDIDGSTPSVRRAGFACEYKAIDDGPVGRFSGYGAVFGNVDAYNERILPGAFTATLADAKTRGRMPAMLWQHNPTQPIGLWRSMREDERGLYVEGELADTQLGREAYSLLKLGALSGLSIGFSVAKESVNRDENIRDLVAINLWEVSPVTFPANSEARVSHVKFTGPEMTIREFERFLRDAGSFSATQAKAIAARGFKALRDEATTDDVNDAAWIDEMARRLSA